MPPLQGLAKVSADRHDRHRIGATRAA